MSDAETSPEDRAQIPITDNCVLNVSRFCIEQCGVLQSDVQGMALMSALVSTGKPVALEWNRGDAVPSVSVADEKAETPHFTMSCKGSRKKYFLFGQSVCRGSLQVHENWNK